ncbi:unnamed protein product [Nippostrongylus brasiliensis]|uniref:Vegetative cell wall protein gp1-like n=1 Tax=Nippostrongylus brasiliensis TaxID=27835 RepID=A0A0N4YH86_NIPBR|nr:unnamed protein product [Nippostrongylus brasiliensis]
MSVAGTPTMGISPTNGASFTVPLPPAAVPYNLPYSPLLPNVAVPGQAPPPPVSGIPFPPTVTPNPEAAPPPSIPSASAVRKAVNGKKADALPDGEKPKRGRPRKIKRSEKCLDEELCEEVTNGIEKVRRTVLLFY